MQRQKKALVIGGSGFLGSHLADELTLKGLDVVIYDQSPSPYVRPDQTFISGSVLDFDQLLLASQGVNYIYNLAAIADIDEAKHRPVASAETNIIGNINALEVAKQQCVDRFILASSVYVNSNSGSFYRITKRSAEEYVKEYSTQNGMPYTILRYGSLYGPRSDDRNTIYRFVRDALEKQSVTYVGQLDSVRQYIHILDAVKMSYDILAEDYINQTLTLTGPETFTIKDVVLLLSEQLGEKITIDNPFEKNDGSHYVLSPYRYQREISKKLTLNNQVAFQEGMLQLIKEIDNSFLAHLV
jgi:UDP-glucose 4-epimerase